MIPTPASCAAGRTSSSGFRRKQLRMIWTLATCGPSDRAQRLRARLDRDAVGADPAGRDHLVERVEHCIRLVDPSGGQCSCTRSMSRRPGSGASGRSRPGIGSGCSSPGSCSTRRPIFVAMNTSGWRACSPATELLAAAVPVDVRCVEERHPGLEARLEQTRGAACGSTRPQSAPSCQVPRPTTLTRRPSPSIARCSTRASSHVIGQDERMNNDGLRTAEQRMREPGSPRMRSGAFARLRRLEPASRP